MESSGDTPEIEWDEMMASLETSLIEITDPSLIPDTILFSFDDEHIVVQ